jgi:hypothetical protein
MSHHAGFDAGLEQMAHIEAWSTGWVTVGVSA